MYYQTGLKIFNHWRLEPVYLVNYMFWLSTFLFVPFFPLGIRGSMRSDIATLPGRVSSFFILFYFILFFLFIYFLFYFIFYFYLFIFFVLFLYHFHHFSQQRWMSYYYKGHIFCYFHFCLFWLNNQSHSEKTSILKGKNLLPLGANSSVLAWTPFRRGIKVTLTYLPPLKMYPFTYTNKLSRLSYVPRAIWSGFSLFANVCTSLFVLIRLRNSTFHHENTPI